MTIITINDLHSLIKKQYKLIDSLDKTGDSIKYFLDKCEDNWVLDRRFDNLPELSNRNDPSCFFKEAEHLENNVNTLQRNLMDLLEIPRELPVEINILEREKNKQKFAIEYLIFLLNLLQATLLYKGCLIVREKNETNATKSYKCARSFMASIEYLQKPEIKKALALSAETWAAELTDGRVFELLKEAADLNHALAFQDLIQCLEQGTHGISQDTYFIERYCAHRAKSNSSNVNPSSFQAENRKRARLVISADEKPHDNELGPLKYIKTEDLQPGQSMLARS